MTDIIDEVKIRERNEITIPFLVRDILNLKPGDYLRFERKNSNMYVCKAVTHKINNNCGGGIEDEDKEMDTTQH